MSNLLFVKRVPLVHFYKRRISRILPAFLLFVPWSTAWRPGPASARGWDEIIATLLFLRTYLPAQPDIWSTGLPIGHLWSLNVEEHSYVFLSLLTLFAVLRGREAWVLGAVSMLVMALYYVYETSPRFADDLLRDPHRGRRVVPARLCRLLPRQGPHRAAGAALDAAGGAGPGDARATCPHAHWWMSAIVSPIALAFCVNHLAVDAHLPCASALASWPLRQMGIWSYSIYLWQQPFFAYKASLPGRPGADRRAADRPGVVLPVREPVPRLDQRALVAPDGRPGI